jgi:hypothetical protein
VAQYDAWGVRLAQMSPEDIEDGVLGCSMARHRPSTSGVAHTGGGGVAASAGQARRTWEGSRPSGLKGRRLGWRCECAEPTVGEASFAGRAENPRGYRSEGPKVIEETASVELAAGPGIRPGSPMRGSLFPMKMPSVWNEAASAMSAKRAHA